MNETIKQDLGTVNIIGGGIAGLATALALKTLGIDYNIFEKSSEIKYENVGLGISANIFPILEKWKILEETRKLGTEIQDFYFVDKDLNYLNSFKMKSPALSVNRRLFYQLLNERLDKEKMHLNCIKSINDFSENEIVISADGINSVARQKYYPNLKIRNSNQILWRGISKIKLSEKFQNAYHDFIGGNLRFAIIHTGGDYYSWYVIKQKINNEKVTLDKNTLKTFFKNYHPIVNSVIDKTKNVYFSELLDINPNDRKNLSWSKKKKLLIGDAIHPTTPNMANGACLAMEDAYLLANLLSKSSLTLEEIFEVFQKQRTKKVDRIVVQSWWFGKLFHSKSKVFDYFIKAGIAITPNFLFDKIYSNVLVKTKVDDSYE